MNWQLAEAKNKFSEVFDRALSGEAQHIRRYGRKQEAVVILSEQDYEKLAGKRGKKSSLAAQLLSIPKIAALDLTRDKDLGRTLSW